MNHLKNLSVWIEKNQFPLPTIPNEVSCIYGFWKIHFNSRKLFISHPLKEILGISPSTEPDLREIFNLMDINNRACLFKWVKGTIGGEKLGPIYILIKT